MLAKQIKEMRKLYDGGVPVRDLCRIYGVSSVTIYHNLKKTANPITPALAKKVVALWEEGKRKQQIAKTLNLAYVDVVEITNKHPKKNTPLLADKAVGCAGKYDREANTDYIDQGRFFLNLPDDVRHLFAEQDIDDVAFEYGGFWHERIYS